MAQARTKMSLLTDNRDRLCEELLGVECSYEEERTTKSRVKKS